MNERMNEALLGLGFQNKTGGVAVAVQYAHSIDIFSPRNSIYTRRYYPQYKYKLVPSPMTFDGIIRGTRRWVALSTPPNDHP